MTDRIPVNTAPNGAIKYGIYDATGALIRYEYIKNEDGAVTTGTALNKANLLTDATATGLGLPNTATVNEAIAALDTQKTDTGHAHTVSNITGLTPTVTELNYVDGVTSAIQTQLNGKQSSLGFTAVPNTRTVNNKALSANITLAPSDITGAYYSGNLPLNKYGWKLNQSYTTAGTYTFTAPDLYNGASYEVGVFIAGGGGSGGSAVSGYWAASAYAMAGGGASGYSTNIVLTVTPNTGYSVVVGAGGAAKVLSFAVTGQDYCRSENGNNGGTSSFNGVSVSGGEGGKASSSSSSSTCAFNAKGAQSSDFLSIYTSSILSNLPAPAMGQDVILGNTNYSYSYVMPSRMRACDTINLFNMKKYFGAGGGAWLLTQAGNPVYYQTVPTLDDGLVAGAGNAVLTSTNSSTATASAATSLGSGGGGAAAGTSLYSGSNLTATSGAGKAGAVLIYTRMVV